MSKARNHLIILNLGTNKWYFYNDNACINEKNKEGDNVYVEDINFSPCSLNDFNCFDGTWYKFLAIKIICKTFYKIFFFLVLILLKDVMVL